MWACALTYLETDRSLNRYSKIRYRPTSLVRGRMARMEQFFAEVRPWAELAYFTSAAVLAVVSIIGLLQISLLKKDIRLRNDRAAKEKAIEYSHRYLTVFIPLYNTYLADRDKKGFTPYGGAVGDFSPESLRGADRMIARKKGLALAESCLPALNELQSIASAFMVGVADERVGFDIIGRTYCHSVRDSYDILAGVRWDKTCPYFQSIVGLYQVWASRMSKAELSALTKDLASQIRNIPDAEVPPIGSAD